MKNKSFTHRSLAVVFITILLMVAIPVASAFAAAPAQYSAAGSNVTFTGSSDNWTNTGNVTGAPNDARAQATISNSGNVSAYLEATTVANTFSIPSDATIKGIQVAIERSSVCQTACTSSVTDSRIRIVKGGVVQSTDRSLTTAWPATDTVANYGSASDLWGATWTPADINDAGFGVAIAATRSSGGAKIARVDSVMITVTYTRPTSTTVASSKASSTYGESITFTATVDQSAATGTVEFYDGSTLLGTGTLSSGSPNTATFSIDNLAAGSYSSITAKYLGDSTYVASTSSAITQSVGKADAACNITGFTGSYDGTAHGASGSCKGVFNENAGTLDLGTSYTDFPGGSAHWSFTGSSNYNDQSGDVLIDISKGEATCSVSGFTGSYDGTAHGASGSCSGFGGENAGTLDLGDSFTNVPGGSAHWVFTGNSNYNDQSDDVLIDISKGEATCSVSGFTGSYDGTAHGASGSCSGFGGEAAGTLDLGGSFTNVPGGSAHWSFTGNSNYNDQSGDSEINIAKADAVIVVNAYSVTYDGSEHTATGTAAGVLGEDLGANLDLSATAHTEVGEYNDPWTFTMAPDANYNSASGTVKNLISAKLVPDLSLTGGPFTYDGSLHFATVTSPVAGTVSDVKYLYNGSAVDPRDAHTYTVTADFLPDDPASYETLNDVVAGTITINKTDADCSSIAGYTVTYDGASHTATGSCVGVGSDGVLAGLDLSATAHIDVGTYNGDPWTFTDLSGNYNNASGTVNNVINPVVDTIAPAVVSVVRVDADNTPSPSVKFTVTFSEAVTGVDTSAPYADFGLYATGVSGATITAVSGTGAAYDVTVNTGSGTGTLRLDVVNNGSIQDAGSNPLGGAFTSGEMYTITEGVEVTINQQQVGPYSLQPTSSVTVNSPATVDGPVLVESLRGGSIFTSQRVISGSSFNEIMGLPTSQLTTEYWFPYYDNVSMDTWILVGNPSDTQSASVDIYVGTAKYSYTVPQSGRITPRFAGKQTGPVRVVSTNGVKVITSERSLYKGAFNEVMGYPAGQFTTEYWFPWYDNVSMSTWILVGNPSSTQTATVDVYVGTAKHSYSIPAKSSVTPRYAGVQAGPVRVVSTNGVKIFSSERTLAGDSFNEVMGSPANQFTTEYFYPWYDNTTMDTWVLVGNPTANTAAVDIYIGGTKVASTTVGAGKEKNLRFNLNTGPVRVVSTNGVKIFTSQRVLYGTSFNEVMGYAGNQLSTEYWFPWYDSSSMSTDILVGRP